MTIHAAIDAAEAEALTQHEAGLCHLSEWSCSHCELDEAKVPAPALSAYRRFISYGYANGLMA